MRALLDRTTFDAVFVGSDVVALGAIGALREAGIRVPHDCSVVGFDDIPLAAYFDPPLTTIRLPASVQDNKIEAAYMDGILTIKLPKAVETPKTKVTIK